MGTPKFKKFINVYEFDSKLPGSGETVKFKPITTKQLKQLLTYENSDDVAIVENILDKLISQCVVDEDFDIQELYMQDRFKLLVDIRKKTRGEKYRFDYTCSGCQSQSVQTIDLNKLEVKELKLNKHPKTDNKKSKVKTSSTGEEPLGDDIIVINDDIKVRLDHIKRKDQFNAFKIVDSMNKENFSENKRFAEVSTLTYASTIRGIITPDGEDTEDDLTIEDKVEFLDNLTQEQYEKLFQWYEKNDFGVDFKITVECPHCGKALTEDVPMENFFF